MSEQFPKRLYCFTFPPAIHIEPGVHQAEEDNTVRDGEAIMWDTSLSLNRTLIPHNLGPLSLALSHQCVINNDVPRRCNSGFSLPSAGTMMVLFCRKFLNNDINHLKFILFLSPYTVFMNNVSDTVIGYSYTPGWTTHMPHAWCATGINDFLAQATEDF